MQEVEGEACTSASSVEVEGDACTSASSVTTSQGHERAHVPSSPRNDGEGVVGGGASPGMKRLAHDSLDAGGSDDEWDPDETELDANGRARVMARSS